MTSALFSALSGLVAHENWINVIGNNLANTNTPGFKSSHALFADQFSQTLRFASAPSGGLGGVNPMQIGLGVQLAAIGRNMGQGALTTTGRVFDLALQGQGLFVLNDGLKSLYTRVGTFGLDASSRLVDQRTGFNVLGVNGLPIDIDATSPFPPAATGSVGFSGNLPAQILGPLPQVLASTSGFEEGTAATLTGAMAGPYTIPVGETWTMELKVSSGAPQTVSITSSTGTVTAQEIVDAINALPSSGVSASVAGGAVQIRTDRTGKSATLEVLPGPAGKDLASVTGLPTAMVMGTEATATTATLLNDLPGNLTDYQPGDTIEISGVDTDGTPVSASFVFGSGPGQSGTTLGALVSFLDNLYPNATASLDAATGQIRLSADQTGATSLSLLVVDGSGASGTTQWSQNAFQIEQTGTGPDTATTSIEVFDSAGIAHTVTFTLERQDDGSWNVTPSVPPGEGTVSGALTGLQFGSNGSILALPSSTSFTVTFNGQGAQSVALDLGTPGLFDGLTQFGAPSSAVADKQDGYGVGELSNLSVDENGDIQGFYTNGQLKTLAALGIATFDNVEGLQEVGSNLWMETANSGQRILGQGAQGRAGTVVGGALEGSNVEIAEQFVRLIEAQRGFQANARVITATDEVLRDLVNLI